MTVIKQQPKTLLLNQIKIKTNHLDLDLREVVIETLFLHLMLMNSQEKVKIIIMIKMKKKQKHI